MAIYKNGQQGHPYRGDHRPVNIYQGRNKIAGWKEEIKSGESIVVEGVTYNDVADVIVEGNTVQKSDYYGKDGELTQASDYYAKNGALSQEQSVWSTNLISNGDFSEGLNKWSFPSANTTYSVTNGILSVSNPITDYMRLRQSNIKFNKNDILYLAIKCESQDTAWNINLWTDLGFTGFVISNINRPTSSIVSAVNSVAYGADSAVELNIHSVQLGTPVHIDNVLLVNLTKEFGAEKEPTKEQCDLLYTNWFDGKSKVSNDIITYPSNSPSPDYPSPVVANLPSGTYKTTLPSGEIYEFTLSEELRGINTEVDKVVFDRLSKKGFIERRIGKKVLNGTENWSHSITNSDFSCSIENALGGNFPNYCSHYKWAYDYTPELGYFSINHNNSTIVIDSGIFKDVVEFKIWLTANLPYVIYRLKTTTSTPLTFNKVTSSTATEIPMQFLTNTPDPLHPADITPNLKAGTYKYTSTDGIYEFTLDDDLRGIGTSVDKVVFDSISKRGYLERRIGFKTFNGTENWAGEARVGGDKWAMNTSFSMSRGLSSSFLMCNRLKVIGYYVIGEGIAYYNNGTSLTITLSDVLTGLTSSSTTAQISAGIKNYILTQYNANNPIILYYPLYTPTRTSITFTKVASSTKTEVPMTFLTDTPSLDYPAEVWDVEGNARSHGKNIFNPDASLWSNIAGATYSYIKIPKTTRVSISLKSGMSIPVGVYFGYTVNGANATAGFRWFVNNGNIFNSTYQSDNQYSYLSIYPKNKVQDFLNAFNVMLSLDTAVTEYEPFTGYAEQQLPTLRKIGTVADTYNPKTGVLTKRISDWVTLDGSKNWIWHRTGTLRYVFRFVLSNPCIPNYATALKYNSVPLRTVVSTPSMLADDVAIDNANGIQVGVSHIDTGFYSNMIPTDNEIKAYFYGWKMCNADGTSPYYKSEVPYTPSTWAEWDLAGTIISNNYAVVDNNTSTIQAEILTTLKTNTKYGLIFNVRLNTRTIDSIMRVTGVSHPWVDGDYKIRADTTGNFKVISTTKSDVTNINKFATYITPNTGRIEYGSIRIFELPTGSQIETDFNTLTADQLVAKYTFNGLCVKNWKHVTDGLGQTSVLPTVSYDGYTPYKMLYQLAEPQEIQLEPTPVPTYYPTTIIETDCVNAIPTMDITVKVEE